MRVLQEAVGVFLTQYQMFGEATDKIGVTYFDSDRSDFSGGAGLRPMSDINAMITDVNNQTPGSATCIGGGILAAEIPLRTLNETLFCLPMGFRTLIRW